MTISLLRSSAARSFLRTSPISRPIISLRMASSSSNIVPLIINGKEVKSSSTFEVKHPRTREVTSVVHAVGRAEVDQAIAGAKAAFKDWSRRPAGQRRDILNKAADLIAAKYDTHLKPAYERDTSVSGIVFGTDKGYGCEHLRSAASVACEIKGELPQTVDGSLALVTREPFGVCLAISPFNFGITLGVRAFCYALATGNTVLWKANPQIPSLHYELTKIMLEAGIPDGVLQAIQLTPGSKEEAELVEYMIAHKDVRHVNFTGSTRVGSIIGSYCGKYVKPVLLELGGNAPAIVLPSADLKTAANNIVFGAMLHSGHICMSTNRVIVVESVADEMIKELEAIAQGDVAGLGRMELASQAGTDRMHEYVDDAVSKGARKLGSSEATPKDNTASFTPTILADVTSEHKIYHEETFGPSLVVIRAKDTEDAIRIANDVEVGLSASVWGEVGECLKVAKEVESGAVHINAMTVHDEPNLPHGGMKSSGVGRFNGIEGGRSFTQTKCITIHNSHMLPISYLK